MLFRLFRWSQCVHDGSEARFSGLSKHWAPFMRLIDCALQVLSRFTSAPPFLSVDSEKFHGDGVHGRAASVRGAGWHFHLKTKNEWKLPGQRSDRTETNPIGRLGLVGGFLTECLGEAHWSESQMFHTRQTNHFSNEIWMRFIVSSWGPNYWFVTGDLLPLEGLRWYCKVGTIYLFF